MPSIRKLALLISIMCWSGFGFAQGGALGLGYPPSATRGGDARARNGAVGAEQAKPQKSRRHLAGAVVHRRTARRRLLDIAHPGLRR